MIRQHFVLFTLLFGFIVPIARACSWPSVFNSTQWRDSRKGLISFTTDTMTGWEYTVASVTRETWQCHSIDRFETDGFLVLRATDLLTLFATDYFGYICLKFEAITDVSYRYYIHNPQQVNVNNERLLVSNSPSVSDFNILCQVEPPRSEYTVILKSGSENQASVSCPYVFLGRYGYTHTSADGTVTCDSSTSKWDVCTNSHEMTFDYSACSTKVAFSVSNSVTCVDTIPSGGDNYVVVYNGNDADAEIDDVNTFRFSCFAVSSDGSQGSVVPGSCIFDQTPETFGSSDTGATIQMNIQESCVSCVRVTAPDSGSVSYSTEGAVTSANYECSPEYSLAGSATRTCQANLTWSGDTPTCTCIIPDPPANGSVSVSTDGTTISYTCDVGFTLVGSVTRSCQTNFNTWSGTAPSCEMCSLITTTEGLDVQFTTDGLETSASFSCAVNYTMTGNRNSTCIADGKWQDSFPTCVQCVEIENTQSKLVTFSTDGYVTSATFGCVQNYTLHGQEVLVCLADGTWDATEPKCRCDDPPAPQNGSVAPFIMNSAAVYECDEGFNLIGSVLSICNEDGSGWSEAPTCEKCNDLITPTGGYFTASTDGEVTMVTYSCDAGYTLVGSRTSHCLGDGTWNSSAPTCVKCEGLVAPSSGQITIQSDGAESTATFTCADGYDMTGSISSTCQADGTWSNSVPTCKCSAVSEPADGSVVYDDGETAYYSCALGYTINGDSVRTCSANGSGWSDVDPTCVMCNELGEIGGGNTTLVTDGTITRAGITCNVGYTINGKTLLTCSASGTWDYSQPTCALCGSLTSPSGGTYSLFSDGDTVTKATFTCDVGYTLSGSALLTCDETGNWDLTPPVCAECSTRVSPTSGTLNTSTDGLTTTANYDCAAGYTLIGQSIITCRTDGNWNYPPPTCQCDTPPAPGNGSVQADGSTLTYSCNVGYTMQGTSTGVCQTDGSGWSITTPECVPCEETGAISGGDVTLETNGVTTVAVYNCSVGSSLLGSASVTCSTGGTWNTEQPSCVSCSNLPDVSSGSVSVTTNGTESIATYECMTGYHVSGSSQLICTTNGTWTSEPSTCVCDTLEVPTGGTVELSDDGLAAFYTCDVGFTADGEVNMTCSLDGSGWSFTEPTCVQCEVLTAPDGGNVTLVTSGSVTTAEISCDVGSTLDGSVSPTCNSDGTWTSSSGTCVSCPNPDEISSGSLSITTNGQTTTAVYTCATGYDVVGSTTITCLTTGSWSDIAPSCYCSVPDPPANGTATVSLDRSTVTYTCDEGFVMQGADTRTCQTDGQGWTGVSPNCTSCSSVTSPSNGQVETSTNGTVTVATFSCDVGYTLNGHQTLVCMSDGVWDNAIPSCVQCQLLSVSGSGSVDVITDGTTTSASFSCSAGYRLLGTSSLQCLTDGTWTDGEPACVCEDPPSPSDGNVSLSADYSTATYTCTAGSSINGVSVRTCSTSGAGWSHSEPSCVTCPNTTEVSGDGQYETVSNGTVTSVRFTCSEGASLDGTSSLECQGDGTWSTSQPSCVTCPTLTAPSSGSVSIATDGLVTTATYSCLPGYKVTGDNSSNCLTSGEWSSAEPSCDCIVPDAPVNGDITLSEDSRMVNYTCNVYFTMIGSPERTCQEDGSGWNGTDPQCVQCSALMSPNFGSVVTSTDGTVTSATFTCDVGKSMKGSSTSVCKTDGTWTTSEPTCESCDDVVQPGSGSVSLGSNGTTTLASFSCSPGYYIDGAENVSCDGNGNWVTSFPSCLCEDPAPVENGALAADGTVATYTCNLGYTMLGNTGRICGDAGSGWSGNDPICVECPNLGDPLGGKTVLSTNGSVTKASVTCNVGSTLSGNSELTCGNNGAWDTVLPSCVGCDDLAIPANGNFTFTSDGSSTSAQLICMPGYEVTGSSTIICQTDGTWTLSQDSTCEESGDSETGTSYLEALIGVSVASLIIIAVLGALLAWFVYQYFRRRNDADKYTPNTVLTDPPPKYQTNTKINHSDDIPDFNVPDVKLAPSAAPVNHQRHVMEDGNPLTSSPAPAGFDRHVTDLGPSPRSPAPADTTQSPRSVTSFSSMSSTSRGNTSLLETSIASLNSVAVTTGYKQNQRLTPLVNHGQMMSKLNGTNGRVSPFTKRSVTPVKQYDMRPTTPVNHSFVVDNEVVTLNKKSKAMSDVDN